MKKILITAGMLLFLITTGIAATAQDTTSTKAADVTEPSHTYRLDFTVSELDDAKKINSRQYSMNLNAGDQSETKIGTRVPVEAKSGEVQYIDVGTSIWCRMQDRKNVAWLGSDVMLNVKAEVSNFAMPEQQVTSTRPILRQLKIDASTIAVVGKPTVIGAVDDPNSKRQFQLEVTVTKLR
jgi:hypothetical protein